VVKRVLPHLVRDPAFVKMFIAEARLSARLTHANIVQVFELGETDGEYFLAMEYVRGKDLISLLRAYAGRPPLPIGFAAFCIREVCRALDYAHNLTDDLGRPLRLVHRDVSPSNVMISFDGGVKLLDFGIAKALAEANEHRTATGTLKGKFAYMAPEQVEGQLADHRADLFAAGIMLHEILSHKRLFKGESDLQTLSMVRAAQVAPPSANNPEVPPELDAICLKALAHNREDRYQTCGELAIALDDIVHRAKWGPERVAALMSDTFKNIPTTGSGPILAPASQLDSVGTISSLSVPAVTVSSRVQRRRQRSSRQVVLAIVTATLIIGSGWLLFRKIDRRAATATPVTTPPVTKPEPAPPAEVAVSVGSVPPGADVFINDESASRGRTPTTVRLSRGDGKARIRLSLGGYEDTSTEIGTHADGQVQVALSRATLPQKPHVKKSKSARRGGAQKIDGDLVDPFSAQ
jgi:serine/threonine protein kinase